MQSCGWAVLGAAQTLRIQGEQECLRYAGRLQLTELMPDSRLSALP